MSANAATFSDLERRALAHHATGEDDAAITAAATAARFVHGSGSGALASAPLEAVLLDIGCRRIAAGPPPSRVIDRRMTHVLHVLTETYYAGGHTRLARRWIDLDADRRHSVFVTGRQGVVTNWLSQAAASSGGTSSMCSPRQTALARAQALRAAASTADVVVVHAHPFDPVPLLAFASPHGRPPVVLVNHADHAFWLGVGIADVVAEITWAGAELSRSRRGVAPERQCMLSIPLFETTVEQVARERAREVMGIDADRPVLLTAASPYKYGAVVDPSFTELAVAVLRHVPKAMLIAVGPEENDVWRRASRQVDGRIHAVGYRQDLDVAFAAADVYLDSWPCSSGTSLLEAALSGLPIVSFVPDAAAQGPLTPTVPSLVDHLVRCPTIPVYAETVGDLLRDPASARRLGAQTRQRVMSEHAGPAWREALEALLDTAGRVAPAERPRAIATEPPAAWQALLEALHSADATALTPEQAAAAERARPVQPRSGPVRRAFAAPAIDDESITAVVEAFIALRALDEVSNCIVILDAGQVEAGVALLERALTTLGDIDIDVLTCENPFAQIQREDVFVAEPDSAQARVASARGAIVRVVLPGSTGTGERTCAISGPLSGEAVDYRW